MPSSVPYPCLATMPKGPAKCRLRIENTIRRAIAVPLNCFALRPLDNTSLETYQGGQLHANIVQDLGRNRGSGVADRAGQRVDAAHVTRQDLPGNRQPHRQHDAGAKGPDTWGDRAN